MLLDDSSGAVIELTCGLPMPTIKATDTTEHLNLLSNNLAGPNLCLEGVTATGRTIDLKGIDVGTVVKAKGGIRLFRGEKQMHVERICKSQAPVLLHRQC